ncbi:MAG: hypothetical protein QI223_04310 [Candidatus Korarchaeota archaeon]|nr:hypothetical protein [Candidatus Korarchaeota archaeon]
MSAVIASLPEPNGWIKGLTVLSLATVLGVTFTRNVTEGLLESLLGAFTSGTITRLLQSLGK